MYFSVVAENVACLTQFVLECIVVVVRWCSCFYLRRLNFITYKLLKLKMKPPPKNGRCSRTLEKPRKQQRLVKRPQLRWHVNWVKLTSRAFVFDRHSPGPFAVVPWQEFVVVKTTFGPLNKKCRVAMMIRIVIKVSTDFNILELLRQKYPATRTSVKLEVDAIFEINFDPEE